MDSPWTKNDWATKIMIKIARPIEMARASRYSLTARFCLQTNLDAPSGQPIGRSMPENAKTMPGSSVWSPANGLKEHAESIHIVTFRGVMLTSPLGFKDAPLLTAFFQSSGFSCPFTQIIQTSAAYFSSARHFDFFDPRRMRPGKYAIRQCLG